MASVITMPAIVADASSALLANWYKQPGDTIQAGEPLAEIETEKATVDYESEASGTLAQLLVAAGDEVAVGTPIAVLTQAADTEEQVAQALAQAGAGAGAQPAPAAAPEAAAPPAGAAGKQAERTFSSPLARRMAREHRIDLAQLEGSGPSGRIVRSDVEKAIAASAPASSAAPSPAEAQQPAAATAPAAAPSAAELPAGATRIELTRMRKAIARRLTESKSTVPHFYLSQDIEVDALLALRQQLKAASPARITVNDLILKAVAHALIEVPAANACWNGGSITQFSTADISVAIATDTGLVTPVLRGAQAMSLGAVSSTVADFAARAKNNALNPAELAGGSFTVSNLGMFGTQQFTAILNPPQAGILAVGAAAQRPVVKDGQLQVATVMTCTLSADHRVMDGAVAAQLLAAIQRNLEQPLSLLV
ncbi:acetyltransferase component of pyruvate dehydrogenase complex [Glutamicibacter uratoxydans]|uniref:Dihydrolipoamide acetyltransferase component of pyruvate dehydrogenase complex n=1 Tax=Glutamicibacter uratoxydans TaxID=43667 RepID=A0A4Y4DKJ9_GLUUR|nr:dihydrolipoamide acetyltransferase family protein [Glutamicibacter uratoxydans]GED05822.1 acetyltransferase component of pyruvate dehydrogenase complex [Glutamicibacter uratoxydans]